MERQNSGKDLEGLLVVTVEQAVAAPIHRADWQMRVPEL